jgi:hypothetical protein
VRLAYADPPYPGQSKKHYGDHEDYAGEVDHVELVEQLEDYDGWCLHTSSPALRDVLPLCPEDARVLAWVKPFAVFKRNVPVAYAWEPVIVRACRKPVVSGRIVVPLRDWLSVPVVLNGGAFAGAKPAPLCWWLFETMGAEQDDELVDLFPGTGAVSDAWRSWKGQAQLAYPESDAPALHRLDGCT